MPSSLYEDAYNGLSVAERGAWDRVVEQLEVCPSYGSTCGKDVLAKIREESYLGKDCEPQSTQKMVDFMKRLADAHWSGGTCHKDVYEGICASFKCAAPPIAAKPLSAALYRYINGDGLFVFGFLENLRGRSPLHQALSRDIDCANQSGSSVTWGDVLRRIQRIWHEFVHVDIRLGPGQSMFVSWDGQEPLDRTDSQVIFDALALPNSLADCFVEVKLSCTDATVLQYPTVADAGWYREFAPPKESDDHGFTKSRLDDVDDQPEAVMPTPTTDGLHPADIRLV